MSRRARAKRERISEAGTGAVPDWTLSTLVSNPAPASSESPEGQDDDEREESERETPRDSGEPEAASSAS
ncbi:MAG: hypothetical protein ACJ77N_09665 [Chloroflexota bacterium]